MLNNEISFSLSCREILCVVILLGICFVWCAICFIISMRRGEKQDEKCTRKCIHMLRKDFLYMGVIASITVVLLLTLTFATDGNAVNYFSFAGMLSSIILSVIAIFMTINSENESKEAKIQLDKSIEKMENTAQKIEKDFSKSTESNEKLLAELEKQAKANSTLLTELEIQKKKFEDMLSSAMSILEESKKLNQKMDNMLPVREKTIDMLKREWGSKNGEEDL